MFSPVLFINGLLLGLGAAVPLGPVNIEIARKTLHFGRAAGILLGAGAVTIDVTYAIVTSVAVVPVRSFPRLMTALAIAASLFLAYLAFLCLRSAFRGHDLSGNNNSTNTAPNQASHYFTGLLMTLLNPMTLVFWFVAFPGTMSQLTPTPKTDLPIVCAGVFLGAFSWVIFFTWLMSHLRRIKNPSLFRWFDATGGLLLLAFAVRSICRVAATTL